MSRTGEFVCPNNGFVNQLWGFVVPLRISNTSGRLLCVELAGGRTLHLAPGETSPEVDEADARPSATIDRLAADGLLALSTTPGTTPTRPTKSTRKTAPTRSRD
jgi:hypothetical protein